MLVILVTRCQEVLALIYCFHNVESESHSVVSNSWQPHTLSSPWISPGQNTGVDSLSFSRGSSQPRDWTQVSRIAGGFFFFIYCFLMLFIKKKINWRIIALQNFVFCKTWTWTSHRYTYIPSLLNVPSISLPSHPSRLIQSTCLSFLSHTANYCCLSILHMVI